mgnify:CR=1 FL=1
MGQGKYAWVLFILLSSSLAGCLSEDSSEPKINLIVDSDKKSGTLVESYSDGELISTTNVSIDFDFSLTTADNNLLTFGIETMDGRSPIMVNASSNSIIRVDFYKHGIYNISAYSIDEENLQQKTTISIQIDLKIEWVESNTNNPKTLTFDPTPTNGGPNPVMIEINSVVENPSLIEDVETGGQSVQISWNIVDEQNDVCQKKTAQIADGDSDSWYTIHFNTFLIHELSIIYEDGQENINVNQSITILYDS